MQHTAPSQGRRTLSLSGDSKKMNPNLKPQLKLKPRLTGVLAAVLLCLCVVPALRIARVGATSPVNGALSIRQGSIDKTTLQVESTYNFSVSITKGSGTFQTMTLELEDAVSAWDIKITYTKDTPDTFVETTDVHSDITLGSHSVTTGSSTLNVTIEIKFDKYQGVSIDVNSALKDVRVVSTTDAGSDTDTYADVFKVYGGSSPINTAAVTLADSDGTTTDVINVGKRYSFTIVVTAGLAVPPSYTELGLEGYSGTYSIVLRYTYGSKVFSDQSTTTGCVILVTSDCTAGASSPYTIKYVVDVESWPGVSQNSISSAKNVQLYTYGGTGYGSDTDVVSGVFHVVGATLGGPTTGTIPSIPGIPILAVVLVVVAVLVAVVVMRRRQ